MNMRRLLMVALVLIARPVPAQEMKKYSFPPAPQMVRADIYASAPEKAPVGVLVLCPGRNHEGEDWVQDAKWLSFAKASHLGLVVASFASPDEILDRNKGYPCAGEGSGQILLDAIHKIYGSDLPIFLYGFSAGGVFTYRFTEWKPERVLAWCAYAGDMDPQKSESAAPPGIVACGEYDGDHYGSALSYFKQGRALGKPWLWISLGRGEHVRSPALEEFARQYFQAVLGKSHTPCWVDIDLKKEVSPAEAAQVPSVSGWLPDRGLFKVWDSIHAP
jgi:hypothetical protein